MKAPQQLAAVNQWLAWRHINGTKTPTTLSGAMCDGYNPANWHPWEAVRHDAQPAFQFVKGSGIFGVDLDACIVDGELSPWASEIVDRFATYTELSPSGTGVKLYGLGKCEVKKTHKIGGTIGSKAAAVELFGYGFFAFTGQQFGGVAELADCQEALTWLLTKYFPVAPTPTPLGVPPNGDVSRRVAAYLERCDPAISGSGGSDQTIKTCGAVAVGFDLSEETAFQLLQDWNGRCDPPWNEHDLRRKIAHAVKTSTKPRGFLLGESRAVEMEESSGVDLSAFGEIAKVLRNDPKDPGPLPSFVFDNLPGLIGEMVRHNLATARHQMPELALAASMCLMSVITGRKIKDEQGTRTNLYCIALAPTGGGKDHSRDLNKKILQNSPGADEFLGNEGFASANGLVRAVHEHPSRLFQVDEIGRLLKAMNTKDSGNAYEVGGILLKLYSSSNSIYIGDAHVDASKDHKIVNPHCVVYGTHTNLIWNCCTKENVHEGMIGRVMFFESTRGPLQKVKDVPPPEKITEWVSRWAKWRQPDPLKDNKTIEFPPIVIKYEPDAEARMFEHQNAINEQAMVEEKTHPERSAIWVRTGEKSAKMALLFAAARAEDFGTFRVSMRDVELAILIANWCTRKTVFAIYDRVAAGKIEAERKAILRAVHRGEEKPHTLREISEFPDVNGIDPRRRNEYLDDFVELGVLGHNRRATGGRPALTYWKI